MMVLEGKNILVVGFGRSGRAAARWSLKRGARVVVTDIREEDEFREYISEFDDYGSSILFHFGGHRIEDFQKTDMVIVSPGVPFDLEVLKVSKRKNIPIVCEMELALSEIVSPVIAVSGTNGKSTVTTLISEILKESGKKVVVGGNLGTPTAEIVDTSMPAEYVVLEVSSYQLEVTPSLEPYIGVMLNVTPDHLDRYKSFDDYVLAKRRLAERVRSEGFFVYNADDPVVCDMKSFTSASILPFSAERVLGNGAWVEDMEVVVRLPGKSPLRISLKDAALKGAHNRENIVAAALASAAAGAGVEAVESVIESFKGLPHRLQFVREVRGVEFYDDSKGTNVGAVMKSLEGFAKPVILIAGGLDKGCSYKPLRPLVKEKVKALILIGQAKDIIRSQLGDLTDARSVSSMEEAVKTAFSLAEKGDVVLLSPACASFDMFRDFNERGDVFIREVMKL